MRKNHDVNLGTLPTGNRSYEDIWHCVAIAYDEGIEYAIKVLNGMPSAQPEITRCKECVNYDTSWTPHSAPDRYYCTTMDSFMPGDGYCSYAERRTDG